MFHKFHSYISRVYSNFEVLEKSLPFPLKEAEVNFSYKNRPLSQASVLYAAFNNEIVKTNSKIKLKFNKGFVHI